MNTKNLLLILIVSTVVLVARFLPHWPNFSPLASVILFSGVYAKNKKYIILPFIALLFSDFFIGFYHWGIMLSVYGSFAIIALFGLTLKKHKNIVNTISASLGSALFFFCLTNLAVWFFGNWYTHDFAGLTLSYTLAIPFFKNTIMSNLLYTGLLFGSYETLRHLIKNPSLLFNK
ncbi:MAG: hypothetical protein COV55_03115 [Candidatus Komeilibacteria bacterium CG11_big_fil_rev_8_21_14_0_20_36_20]|uniref:Rod shape-determining protein MreD n=1 Tax=Candidatus Komeilibacteria bacterium CG11_big_fil_rev_8_21_14_0_20_36_20 TaxID=1974477 RepID=A0A2H0NEJ7_9BACT|nr:MAG: hypothetical protein COV55_03115 [Candidatus Komeilibacteria bacterium CG11_big_fil_rev_8_21_14_0_20_36_20]PIR81769.1 MAG: hypothetical protein COU21_01855 [Candidatus Komeilibacteria bacterium CG10_big_fil_rev_8_21_14_0_10_36_65]PJC55809.1 MAG: hypothetical protein CO027_00170 [Candidatus Komeilibacteria bacterium CG_4_9_14_0_2_um_filter_36_13]